MGNVTTPPPPRKRDYCRACSPEAYKMAKMTVNEIVWIILDLLKEFAASSELHLLYVEQRAGTKALIARLKQTYAIILPQRIERERADWIASSEMIILCYIEDIIKNILSCAQIQMAQKGLARTESSWLHQLFEEVFKSLAAQIHEGFSPSRPSGQEEKSTEMKEQPVSITEEARGQPRPDNSERGRDRFVQLPDTLEQKATLAKALELLSENIQGEKHSPIIRLVQNLLRAIARYSHTIKFEDPFRPTSFSILPSSLFHRRFLRHEQDKGSATTGQVLFSSQPPISDEHVEDVTQELVKGILQTVARAVLTDAQRTTSKEPTLPFTELANELVRTSFTKVEFFLLDKIDSRFHSEVQNLKDSTNFTTMYQDARDELLKSFPDLKEYAEEFAQEIIRSIKELLDLQMKEPAYCSYLYFKRLFANMLLSSFAPNENRSKNQHRCMRQECTLEKLLQKRPDYVRDLHIRTLHSTTTTVNEIYRTVHLDVEDFLASFGDTSAMGQSQLPKEVTDTLRLLDQVLEECQVEQLSHDVIEACLTHLGSAIAGAQSTPTFFRHRMESVFHDVVQKTGAPVPNWWRIEREDEASLEDCIVEYEEIMECAEDLFCRIVHRLTLFANEKWDSEMLLARGALPVPRTEKAYTNLWRCTKNGILAILEVVSRDLEEEMLPTHFQAYATAKAVVKAVYGILAGQGELPFQHAT